MKKIIAILFIFMLILPGCQNRKADYSGFLIYYRSEDGKSLKDIGCSMTADESTTEWLDELTEKLNNGTGVPTGGQPLLSADTKILGTVNNSGILTIDIDKGYYDLPVSGQVLLWAGLTKAFTQSGSINAVALHVNGKPAVDAAGNELAVMTAKMFVDESSDGINNFGSSPMTLYFTDETGSSLVEESRTAFYSINTPVEMAVINELISGPSLTMSGHYRTLPPDLNVLSVTIQDDICYVNFDESFTNSVFDMDPKIQIYSIVNSIASVCGVESVAFSINGSSSVVFKDTVDLDQIFSPVDPVTLK